MWSCTGDPRVSVPDAGPDPCRRRGWYVKGGSMALCAPSAGACVDCEATDQSCTASCGLDGA